MNKSHVFTESGPTFDPDRLSTEARRTYDAAQTSFKKEFAPDPDQMKILSADGIKAAYKIEIMFGPKRTPQGPNNVAIQMWESGKHLNGDGDDLMYWCRDLTPGSQLGCGGPIPAGAIHVGIAHCPNCNMMIRADKLTGQYFIRQITSSKLATEIEGVFHKLKDNADIYCKYSPDDIRYQASMRENPERGRHLRGLFIYPLHNILKDTSSGSSLQSRIRAFLSA
jgi:hypothetical protein